MTSPTTLPGIHHVTAIAGAPQHNIDFYIRTLGLRLVKTTINYDDPGTYHLYYADRTGTPGTLMTFFAWPQGHAGRAGTGQATETTFAVPAGSLSFWRTHLAEAGIATADEVRMGSPVLTFADPDGLRLALAEAAMDPRVQAHDGGIPSAHAIHGLHGVTLTETDEALPARVLVDRFGYREIAREANRIRYEAPSTDIGRFVDVLRADQRVLPRMGVGHVHHVAFRALDDAQQAQWLQTLRGDGYNVSPVIDRNYFHSIYFREAGGTLFEIATDGPGMLWNEPVETLGSKLVLPPWLENQRAEVEAGLPPVKLPEAPVLAAR